MKKKKPDELNSSSFEITSESNDRHVEIDIQKSDILKLGSRVKHMGLIQFAEGCEIIDYINGRSTEILSVDEEKEITDLLKVAIKKLDLSVEEETPLLTLYSSLALYLLSIRTVDPTEKKKILIELSKDATPVPINNH